MAQRLAVRISKAGTATVFRDNNGTLVAMGATFAPANGMLTDSAALDKKNMAIQFGQDFYVNVGGDIRKYDPGTQTWISETLPGGYTQTANYLVSGFQIGRGPSGAPRLFSLWTSSTFAAPHRAIFLDPGGSWTLGANGPGISHIGTRSYGASRLMHQNQLHIATGRDVIIYDPVTDSMTVQNIGGGGGAAGVGGAFARGRGRAFMARTATLDGNDEFVNLYEFVGGSYVQIIDGSVSAPTLPQLNATGDHGATAWVGLHFDDTSGLLILHAYQKRTNDGWRVFTMDPDTLTVADITATVVPAALQFPAGPSASDDVHWSFQTDIETAPLAPVLEVLLSIADGSTTRYRWNGISTPMTILGTGGDRGIAYSDFKIGGGEFLYDGSTTTDPALNIWEPQARLSIPGGMRVFLQGFTFDETGGAPTAAIEDVELYFAILDQAPDTLAVVNAVAKESGPGGNPGLSSNKMLGMSMDGTSIYSMDWVGVSALQINNGDPHILVPRIDI